MPAHTGNRQGSNLGCPVSSLELAKQVGAALRREQVRIVLEVVGFLLAPCLLAVLLVEPVILGLGRIGAECLAVGGRIAQNPDLPTLSAASK